ncbi:MAG: UvrD-helicase domain-containing protein, partial [Chitinispirillaceae bacterium]|nr:UvrD-helicase domain-containing protein [Chitinispirillaceae bacterium]
TGKTWTIVNRLVLPMLKGEGCGRTHIRDILLVTYTEKAAGELKTRIRDGIVRLIDLTRGRAGDAGLLRHLEDCLNNLHEAYIGTIHGVCLRLLQTYPFETGMQFTTGMIDDEEGLRSSLRRSIRESWPAWGVDLAPLAAGSEPVKAETVFNGIVVTARECLDPDTVLCADGIEPGSDLTTITAAIRRRDGLATEVIASVRENLPALCELHKNPDGLDDERIEYLTGIIDRWRTVLDREALRMKSDISGGGRRPEAMANKLKKGNAVGVKKNPRIETACRAFEAVAGSPEFTAWKAFGDCEAQMLLALILKTVPDVCKRWTEKKRSDGLISFQDMLRLMHRAVYGNDRFRLLIRSRIRFAVIDEFQDTSVVQWEIFKRLFVDDADDGFSPRLFIVGDPKQSIYSFQNAVVESYLDACDRIREKAAGNTYSLNANYRSTEQLVAGYNTIFTGTPGGDFFLTERITYTADNVVSTPQRPPDTARPEDSPPDAAVRPLLRRPVRIVPLSGNLAERRRLFSHHIADVVTMLHGRNIRLPNGDGWEERAIDYHDFAVIAETHRSADNVLAHLLDRGIPAAKYKQEGVFSSAMAREFRAVLAAICAVEDRAGALLKALLTSFFNRMPSRIDPEIDAGAAGSAGVLFAKWREMADRRAWPRLFRSLLTDSGVRELLVRMSDGERRLCDLRQVMDHALEYLITKQGTTGDLVEHLANLETGIESPGRDENLHARESDRKKVQVMTMHAAKGLEFPVCFVVTGASRSLKGMACRWTAPVDGADGRRMRLHIMPVAGKTRLERTAAAADNEAITLAKQRQERRRLLYVALTRAKALLFVPMHLARAESGNAAWSARPLPGKGADDDLTPLLQKLADEAEAAQAYETARGIGVCRPGNSDAGLHGVSRQGVNADTLTPLGGNVAGALEATELKVLQALEALRLPGRSRIQTSYSAISRHHREATDLSGRKNRETETGIDQSGMQEQPMEQPLLPPGKATGNALHEIIELAVTHPAGLGWTAEGSVPEVLARSAERICAFHGLLPSIKRGGEGRDVIESALRIVRSALGYRYALPGCDPVRLADLGDENIRAEAEFHLGVGDNRVLGYIDLLFRVRNSDGSSRYFIIDWKSNSLAEYGKNAVEASIIESQYDLQARIYCHALDNFLGGLFGASYDPARHLGGALYVYLRGLLYGKECEPTWFCKADPERDRKFVEQKMEDYVKQWESYAAYD